MGIHLLKNSTFQNNHIIKSFLDIPENKKIFDQIIKLEDDADSIKELNKRFKEFFLEIRLRKYISTIIHNSVVELDIRTRKKEQILSPYDDKVQLNDFASTSIDMDKLTSIFTDEKISNALKVLTEKEKKIITLIFFKDLKEVEIAQILNISQQAVSKTKQRALQKIRMTLRREND